MVFKRSNIFLKNELGQTAVEYIMLIAVVMSLFAFIMKSKIFTEYFGDEGKFQEVFRIELEYTYKNANFGREPFREPNYNNLNHKSYMIDGNTTHFFGHKDAYP